MDRQMVAFDRAQVRLRDLGVPAVLPALHAAGIGISHTVLGGSHSVAVYPPIDSLVAIDTTAVATLLRDLDPNRETSLYIHIPFCETRCTFCHYAVQHYPGKDQGTRDQDANVTAYLTALKREIAMWGVRLARSGTVVTSIYIGGGTPLILEEAALRDLLAAITEHFTVAAGAEICVEASPLTITAPDGEDKLRVLKAHGVTRLSFGVQSFNDAVLKYAARGYKRDLAIRATRIAAGVFDNWNLDLIQGLYKGSPLEIWENLQVVRDIQPPHITWYHGRFADRPQRDWYDSAAKSAAFEDEPATLLGRMLIWQELAAIGYHRIDGNRFVRDRAHVDPFKTIRTSPSRNLLGLGTSSYSHVGAAGTAMPIAGSADRFGYLFRNDPGIRGYIDRVSAGSIPIATARTIDVSELLATSYATGLRDGRIETPALAASRHRAPTLAAHYDALVRSLRGLGILDADRDRQGYPRLHLSELGRLFEDETLARFFSPAVQQALKPGITPIRHVRPPHIAVAA